MRLPTVGTVGTSLVVLWKISVMTENVRETVIFSRNSKTVIVSGTLLEHDVECDLSVRVTINAWKNTSSAKREIFNDRGSRHHFCYFHVKYILEPMYIECHS